MSDPNPTILEVIQEDVPNFNNVYLIYMKESKLSNPLEIITLTLRSDIDKVEFKQTFELIYDETFEAYFFKELNTYTKKLICNDLILSNKEFFSKVITVDQYNLLINSVPKQAKKEITKTAEAV
jgi:hypothetical protein